MSSSIRASIRAKLLGTLSLQQFFGQSSMTNFLIYSHQKIYLLFKLSCGGNGWVWAGTHREQPQEHIRRRRQKEDGEKETNTRVRSSNCAGRENNDAVSSGTDRILMPFSLCELVWVLCCVGHQTPWLATQPRSPWSPWNPSLSSCSLPCWCCHCLAFCFAYFVAKLTRCHQSIRMFSSFFTHFSSALREEW